MSKKKFKLNPNVTEKQLYDFGFRNNTYRTNLYKNLIQLVIEIDTDYNWWNFMIVSTDTNELYSSYYYREYGKNMVVNEIDQKVNEIFKQMKIQNIFR